MSSRLPRTLVIACLLIIGTSAHSQQAAPGLASPPEIRLTPLGAIYPDESYAYGVNDWGDVVGTSSVRVEAGFLDFHAFLWRPETGILDLVAHNVPMRFAFDVNFRRQIVGAAFGPGLLWTPGGKTESVTPDAFLASPRAMNDLGQIVGSYLAGGTDRAFSCRQRSRACGRSNQPASIAYGPIGAGTRPSGA